MKPLSQRALRKRRRRTEAKAYAIEARFWRGKIKSAERLGYDRPIDRKAMRELV